MGGFRQKQGKKPPEACVGVTAAEKLFACQLSGVSRLLASEKLIISGYGFFLFHRRIETRAVYPF